MSDPEVDKIISLRDLPRDVAPPRDLWKGIEAQIRAGAAAGDTAEERTTGGRTAKHARSGWRPRLARTEWVRGLSAAAVIAALAVGIWIGREGWPIGGRPMVAPLPLQAAAGKQTDALHAAFMMDARYTRQRDELAKNLQARLAELPPESRAKVIASLATIHKSIQDLQAALGRDPTNALLQELLVNTYQDEMRVLTAVHDAGSAGEGI